MIKLGDCIYIGVSNNWRKMHDFPLKHTKRKPHERKDMPKEIRVKYHTMKNAGCDDDLIRAYIGDWI